MTLNWNIKANLNSKTPADRRQEVIDTLLNSRGIKDHQQFINPPAPSFQNLPDHLPDLDKDQLKKAISIIKQNIKEKKPILIYGDYDCDGVCASAILWRAIHDQYESVLPFIPHRTRHGYGLNQKGLEEALEKYQDEKPLIITVDNGISATQAIADLKKEGYQVIITDHHHPHGDLPPADAIVHTTHLSGSGVAWLFGSALFEMDLSRELVALGTVCDLLPLTGANRMLVKHGLTDLRQTSIAGLKALYQIAEVTSSDIDTYHLGFVIGPRINAVGRLGHALDALRLLCTNNQSQAESLAQKLNNINKERQDLTRDYTQEAISYFKNQGNLPPVLFIANEDYHEGIIGLIAGRLTEYFNRPSVAIAISEGVAKGSARSLPGIHITNLLSQNQSYLQNFGGHEGAAGFSANPDDLESLYNGLLESTKDLDPSLFEKNLDIDLKLEGADLNFDLLSDIDSLAPFGISNPKPVFSVTITPADIRAIGAEKTHLKIQASSPVDHLDIIGFRLAEKLPLIQDQSHLELAFTLQKNIWNGRTSLQLNLKDLRPSQ